MPRLVLGPLLRHVDETSATVWVETDAPCEVEVLGATARTFRVQGHHYALVVVEGLAPGSITEYGVALDGEPAWPPPDSTFPPSVVRTLRHGEPVRILFASCRTAAPHEPPWTAHPDEHPNGRELDALWAYAQRMRDRPREEWPHALLLLGDQVYADEVSPQTRKFIASRRDTSVPPGLEVADYEEYVRLYWESWSEPVVRWLFSTVSMSMIFDDHDVHDDWNISDAWLREYRAKPWWGRRIVAALASYWVYQHLGNLSPEALTGDELWARVREVDDAWEVLEPFAARADRQTDGARWSYARDLAGSRLVMIDSRAGRVVEGRRDMLDENEWKWVEAQAGGDVDHLLIGSSLPWLLPRSTHGLEAWSEAVCAGAWGPLAARVGERVRQALDLEHWAAFGASFERLSRLIEATAAGRRGAAPASVIVLGGDVHFSYLAQVAHRKSAGVRSAVYQATCSPLRNPLTRQLREAARFAASRGGALIGRALEASAGVPEPRIRWRLVHGPWFDNVLATLELDGREARLRVEHTSAGTPANPRLELLFEHALARRG
ncbi:MAG TPA: alkaline phosphatase D family protein [Gaiellaceae bacterium]